MKIEYRNGNIFDASPHATLVHSCNAQGVWGAGIAKQFKDRFPLIHNQYVDFCRRTATQNLVGQVFISSENSRRVACLITSNRYGRYVDNPAQILQATHTSFQALIDQLCDGDEIHMPKINSGLFRTPWSETEKCIEYLLSSSKKDIKCVVWIQESRIQDRNEQTVEQSNNE